jgi:indolepyruvate ferredoxin oxidoreductase beta subunit
VSAEEGGGGDACPVCGSGPDCAHKGSTDILLAGVGGQGILLISQVIGKAAISAGVHFVMSEVHGMAQRGGVVTSHVRLGEINGPLIPTGCADILLAMEPVECLRAIDMAGPRTLVISTTRGIVPFTVAAGVGEYPAQEAIWSRVEARTGQVVRFDATELATGAGAAIASNVVLLGALTGTGRLPIPEDHIRSALEASVPEKFRDVNLKAFQLGYDRTAGSFGE